jgi:hypothetical protein
MDGSTVSNRAAGFLGRYQMKTKLLAPILCVAMAATVVPLASAQNAPAPGTHMIVRLQDGLSTRMDRPGQPFTARVVNPPEFSGAVIRGHIADVNRSGRLTGRTEMSLAFDTIRFPNGRGFPIRAELSEVMQSESVKIVDEEGRIISGNRGGESIKRAGVGAAIGGVLGGLLGGGRGALVGVLLGGGAGAGTLAMNGAKEIRLDPGTDMDIVVLRQAGRSLARTDFFVDRDFISGVQQALNRRGYTAGMPDGRLGPQTRTALRQFQRDNGLVITGNITEETAHQLGIFDSYPNDRPRALARSDYSDTNFVMGIQRALSEQGYDAGPFTGYITTRTSDALRQFQRDRGLPVTGIIDEATADELGVR